MNYNMKRFRYRSIILLFSLFCWNIVFAQFKPVKDGVINVDNREWYAMDIGEVYTPSVTSYDDLNKTWKIYGCGLDFARNSNDDAGGTVLTKIPNGDWELIVRVVSPDYVSATGYAFKEVWLDDGTGTGTNKLYYPGEVLAPQPRFTSSQRYGILFRENLNKRCREMTIGSGRYKARFCARKAYEEDEDGSIITDARYTYSGRFRRNADVKTPTWLRIIKRGNDWSTYYAMDYEENNYQSADDVKWIKKQDFYMELDSANIYAGLFFAPNGNRAYQGSNFEVRDPRVTQTYDNLILREAPPLWQLAKAQKDVKILLDAWIDKDITNMFDHDLTDELNYKIESSDENVAFAYIDETKATDGSDLRILKIKGISEGVVKMRIWWDIGGYHLEDVFYVNVFNEIINPEYSKTLLNHINLGGNASSSVIASEDDETGRIRILRNAGGNNHSGHAKRMYEAALYYPMTWNGTADSIEVTYNELNDSRFFGTGGIALLRNLTDTCMAAGVGENTTVSRGIGYQTSYFYHRPEGSTRMAMRYSPGHKRGDSKTAPNKVLFETQLKLVRNSETSVILYSKRPVDTEWDQYSFEIDAITDYYFILHQSQTRSGKGSYFSGLKINGEEILVEDTELSMFIGQTKRIDILGHLGQKLGENWSNIRVQSADESKFTAVIEGHEFVITNNAMEEDIFAPLVPITITADKDGETITHILYGKTVAFKDFEPVELTEFIENNNSGRIRQGDSDTEFYFVASQNQLDQTTADKCVFLHERVSAADSSDVTVYVNNLGNSGEQTKAGLMIRADNLTGEKQYVALLVTPEDGLKFQYRWKAGVKAVIEPVKLEEGVDISLNAPIYLKIRKVGKWFYPYVSKDGMEWHIARKYAFPLELTGEDYHIGFAASTTANFGLPVKCHITDFEIAQGFEMGMLYNKLPVFNSIEIEEGPLLINPEQYVSIIWESNQKAVVECSIISSGIVRSILYDSMGRVIRGYTPVNLPIGKHRLDLDLGGLKTGMYLLNVSTPAGPAVKKIVINN